jgi:hypothetical protein
LGRRLEAIQTSQPVAFDQHPIYQPTLGRAAQDELTSVEALFEASNVGAHPTSVRGAASSQLHFSPA